MDIYNQYTGIMDFIALGRSFKNMFVPVLTENRSDVCLKHLKN
jgi:hypothetical protein